MQICIKPADQNDICPMKHWTLPLMPDSTFGAARIFRYNIKNSASVWYRRNRLKEWQKWVEPVGNRVDMAIKWNLFIESIAQNSATMQTNCDKNYVSVLQMKKQAEKRTEQKQPDSMQPTTTWCAPYVDWTHTVRVSMYLCLLSLFLLSLEDKKDKILWIIGQ